MSRQRLRDLGIAIGRLEPGPHNAITDVAGVRVGHYTLIRDEPTVVRTGMAGFATATGRYSINVRNLKEWSDPYKVWLPYWQHFTQGMGFHETTSYLHDGSLGSHGCVNLLPADARRFYELGAYNLPVHVFGRRPGT